MASSALFCLPSQRTKPLAESGQIVVLNSPTAVDKGPFVTELEQHLGTQYRRLNAGSRYFPHDIVPASAKYRGAVQRVARLAHLAKDFSGSGFIPVVEWNDPSNAYLYAIKSLLDGPSRGPSARASPLVTTVLLHMPMKKLVDNIQSQHQRAAATGDAPPALLPALVQYGVMYRGSPTQTPHTVDTLTRKDLLTILNKAKMYAGATKEDGQAMTAIAQRFLQPVLGLDQHETVHLEPRVPYDLVLNLASATPRRAARDLSAHLGKKLVTRHPSSLHSLPPARQTAGPVACTHCRHTLTPHPIFDPNERLVSGLPLCSQCLDGVKGAMLGGTNAFLFGTDMQTTPQPAPPATVPIPTVIPTAGTTVTAPLTTPPATTAPAPQTVVPPATPTPPAPIAAPTSVAPGTTPPAAATTAGGGSAVIAKVNDATPHPTLPAVLSEEWRKLYKEYYFVTSESWVVVPFDPNTQNDVQGGKETFEDVQKSVRDGKRWIDPTNLNFPFPNIITLPPEQVPIWKGVPISLRKGTMSLQDITMGGSEGFAWFMTAAGDVALQNNMEAVLPRYDDERGIYEAKLYGWNSVQQNFTNEVRVVVDNRIPFIEGDSIPCYTYSEDKGEMWPTVIEKAYAKALVPRPLIGGGFKQMGDGEPAFAVAQMMGGIAWLMKPKEGVQINPTAMAEDFFRMLSSGHYIHVKFRPRSDKSFGTNKPVKLGAKGLLSSRHYTVLRYRKVPTNDTTFHLIQLRSPWKWERLSDDLKRYYGNEENFNKTAEWAGDWSDDSPLWDKYPEAKVVCEFKKASDGIFWMNVDDFLAEVEQLDVAKPMIEAGTGSGRGMFWAGVLGAAGLLGGGAAWLIA